MAMDASSIASAALSACLIGVASHLFYFIRGEHHLESFNIFIMSAVLSCLIWVFLVVRQDQSLLQAMIVTTTAWTAFVGSLWASMLIYRIFFHPLRSFPGPTMAKITKLWGARKGASFRNFEVVDSIHDQYGDFVRTGPNEISIVDPVAVDLIHGPGSRCRKAPWYDFAAGMYSLQSTRDKAAHDKRRRVVWDRAFSAKALREYENCVVGFADELILQMKANSGRPMNVSEWFNYFTGDTLFTLAFGKSYNMVKEGKGHWFLHGLQKGNYALATFGHIPWMYPFMRRLVFIFKANAVARDWCNEQTKERQSRDNGTKDVAYWFFNPTEPMSDDPKIDQMWAMADSRLLIVAGTDTTSSALTYATYRLCRDPTYTRKIREELAEHNINSSNITNIALQSCTYLQACIDESLRLHPPVPSGLYRITPSEGLTIGDTFVPGGVTVIMPTYSVQRSAKAFVSPDTFIPERWTTKAELILNKKAFMPFNVGAYGCVGKQLAYMELRSVLAKMLLNFDVAFAPGEDGSKLINETKDFFVLGLGDLEVVFTERSA